MGNCFSGAPQHLLDVVDGGEDDYHKRFLEDQVLGAGEFGVVKMVHDVTKRDAEQAVAPLACKVLRKGVVFKDNTLYAPLKPEVLRGEVEMLRLLGGKHFCLKMEAVFETPKLLFLVTEYCGGGEMMEYVSGLNEDLRSEDVSRITFQLLSAVNHCYVHGIIHRDIKPENVMFQDPLPGSELRLIDFGSGTIQNEKPSNVDNLEIHETFAGSAFYISPEMFQRKYTAKTDVWSVGATLYVLVAGYPADDLQKAFNILQTAKKSERDLKALPNLPDNMPDSFYDLLEQLLVYRHKSRPTAGKLLEHEFVTFHRELLDEPVLSIAEVSAAAAHVQQSSNGTRAGSVSLKGSVIRHGLLLGFRKFERALTTLLAAMLSKKELTLLLDKLHERISAKNQEEPTNNANLLLSDAVKIVQAEHASGDPAEEQEIVHNQKLSVCKVSEVKEVLRDDLQYQEVLETMAKIPNADSYDNFAYHLELLVVFSTYDPNETHAGQSTASSGRKVIRRSSLRHSFTAKISGGNSLMTGSNTSVRSLQSLRGSRRGGKLFEGSNRQRSSSMKGPSKNMTSN